jgi:hypothetical protein
MPKLRDGACDALALDVMNFLLRDAAAKLAEPLPEDNESKSMLLPVVTDYLILADWCSFVEADRLKVAKFRSLTNDLKKVQVELSQTAHIQAVIQIAGTFVADDAQVDALSAALTKAADIMGTGQGVEAGLVCRRKMLEKVLSQTVPSRRKPSLSEQPRVISGIRSVFYCVQTVPASSWIVCEARCVCSLHAVVPHEFFELLEFCRVAYQMAYTCRRVAPN